MWWTGKKEEEEDTPPRPGSVCAGRGYACERCMWRRSRCSRQHFTGEERRTRGHDQESKKEADAPHASLTRPNRVACSLRLEVPLEPASRGVLGSRLLQLSNRSQQLVMSANIALQLLARAHKLCSHGQRRRRHVEEGGSVRVRRERLGHGGGGGSWQVAVTLVLKSRIDRPRGRAAGCISAALRRPTSRHASPRGGVARVEGRRTMEG